MIAEVRSSINNPVSVVDVSGSIINQQNNADIKLMEERYQRSAQAVSSLCEEDRKTDEFLNAACKKRVGNEGSERRNFKIPEVTSQREPNSETLVGFCYSLEWRKWAGLFFCSKRASTYS
ncbi:unnamed protein product [Rhizophagus irregularis]|nr:unnamed protein product [Rhizophagus irregularis]